MITFDNPGGKGDNGQCCDGKWVFCEARGCDHKFTVCVDNFYGWANSTPNVFVFNHYNIGILYESFELDSNISR